MSIQSIDHVSILSLSISCLVEVVSTDFNLSDLESDVLLEDDTELK